MASVSTTSAAQSASQSGWQQLKLQQARQNAEQAERVAQSLSAQASEAKRSADRAQENARDISVRSDQAQVVAGRARQGLAAISSASVMQAQLVRVVDQSAVRLEAQTKSKTQQQSSPVVNTQGQLTGTVINTSA